MKKIISLMLSAAVIVSSIPCISAFAETAAPDIAYVSEWNNQTITEQFRSFTDSGSEYTSTGKAIAANLIGKKLGDIDMIGFDEYKDKTYCVKAEKYAINNISNECASAVKFKEFETYYVYKNSDYFPDTLGTLIDALDLENTVSFGSMCIKSGKEVKEIKEYNKSLLKSLLAENRNSEMTQKECYAYKEISFAVNVDVLGINNKSLSIAENGYLTTNIMEWGYAFYIGEETVKELCDSLNVTFDCPDVPDVQPEVTTSLPTTVTENPIETPQTVVMTTNGYVSNTVVTTATTIRKKVDPEKVEQLNNIYEQLKQFECLNNIIFYNAGYNDTIVFVSYNNNTEVINKVNQYIADNGIDKSLVVIETAVPEELESAAETTAVKGDISRDGMVNVADVVILQKYLAKKIDSIPETADLNGDSKINAFDLIMLKRMIMNNES